MLPWLRLCNNQALIIAKRRAKLLLIDENLLAHHLLDPNRSVALTLIVTDSEEDEPATRNEGDESSMPPIQSPLIETGDVQEHIEEGEIRGGEEEAEGFQLCDLINPTMNLIPPGIQTVIVRGERKTTCHMIHHQGVVLDPNLPI